MRRWIDKVAVIALISAFCAPALGYLINQAQDRTVSVSEQRSLAPFPAFSSPFRGWTGQIDNHLEDSFGFRMSFIKTARNVRDNLGENPPLVAYGQGDWVFINEARMRDAFEGFDPWTGEKADLWIDRLSAVRAELSEDGIPFAAVIAPDKARIYPEQTPQDWRKGTRRFKAALDNHPQAKEAGLINVEPTLLALKEDGARVYFKRDTHWSPDGYVPALDLIMDALDPNRERLRTSRTKRSEWSPDRVMDLDGLLGNEEAREPPYPSIRPRFTEGFKIERIDAENSGGGAVQGFETLIASEPGGDNTDTLVIVGDSFADALVAELTGSYGRVVRLYHGVDQYRVSYEQIMAWEPSAVLFVAVERNAIRMDAPFAAIEPQPETRSAP